MAPDHKPAYDVTCEGCDFTKSFASEVAARSIAEDHSSQCGETVRIDGPESSE